MRCRSIVVLVCASTMLLAAQAFAVVEISTGFETGEGYTVGKLTPAQPNPIGDTGWGGTTWGDLGGSYADPMGYVVAPGDAPEGSQYYQRLGGGSNNLVYREFPAIAAADGDFSIRWMVRIDSDQAEAPYFSNYATIEVDDTGPGGRIMTFRYDLNGDVDLGNVQNSIAQWDGSGDADLASALNQFVSGGVNVHWDTKQIEVFLQDSVGGWKSVGVYSFRETNTDQVNRIFLGVGPGGTDSQGVSWDYIRMSSEMIPEPATLCLLGIGGLLGLRRRTAK